jgi:SAM-dependent methyltransferase
VLERLADHQDYREPDAFAGPDHPIRKLTRAMALGEPWTSDDATRIGTLFDGLAPEWSEKHVDEVKRAPVEDALVRGDVPLDADWLEVGSGTGAGARTVAHRVRSFVATDLSFGMLEHAPAELAPLVQSDASALPFANQSFDVILMINMILFPGEVDRVLRPSGRVLWANTLGDQTPIHLSPDDVLAALPGEWAGRTAHAGTGFWLTAGRA